MTVDTETGELVEVMSPDAARRLTERIRIAATNYTEAKAKILTLVEEAKQGAAHLALGYKSWTAYLSDVLSDEPLRLAREERRELVGALADQGMSSRAIAPIVGKHHSTVADDIESSTVGNPTVDPKTTQRETTGLDGRQRTRASAGRVRPRPQAETTLNTIESLTNRASRQAQKLTADQIRRVKPNAAEWIGGIRESLEVLSDLVQSLEEN